MGEIRPALPVKLFIGVLTSMPDLVPIVEGNLIERFGTIDLKSRAFLFDKTLYYAEDMGSPLYRYFFSFQELIAPTALAAAKVATNSMESALAARVPNLKRPVNLDPGYLEQSKIVLASTKNFFHRILIAEGIYAEVTLHFQNGTWQTFPWTFPDFATGQYHEFFRSVRSHYRGQLSRMGVRIRKRPRE